MAHILWRINRQNGAQRGANTQFFREFDLSEQFKKSLELEAAIKKNLKGIGFDL